MKTFEQFLATRPAFEQPRDSDESLRMHIAYMAGCLDTADFHFSVMAEAAKSRAQIYDDYDDAPVLQ